MQAAGALMWVMGFPDAELFLGPDLLGKSVSSCPISCLVRVLTLCSALCLELQYALFRNCCTPPPTKRHSNRSSKQASSDIES